MDEVGVARNQHVGADIGVGMGTLYAVGGHLDVDTVLYAGGAVGIGGADRRQTGWNVNRLNARRI